MKTAATNKKVRELIDLVKRGSLLPKAEFQRRLVWTRNDKNLFLDSILRGFPFPEIFIANGDIDLDTAEGTQFLVDGLQRVTTIVEYFDGSSNLKLTTIPPYKELSPEDKQAFLDYDVAVRDLGIVTREQIVEVFRRINATNYSLLEIEVNNAVYAGELKKFGERVAALDFFALHRIFTSQDMKRMGDLRYALTIVITMMQGYFNRDDALGDMLDRYNDDFPLQDEIEGRILNAVNFVEECGFPESSRLWTKASVFTCLIEVDRAFREGVRLQPSTVLDTLDRYFKIAAEGDLSGSGVPSVYSKAAIQASNDRINRMRRGVIIAGLLRGQQDREILERLATERLNPGPHGPTAGYRGRSVGCLNRTDPPP